MNADLLKAIASILWPAIALVVLLKLWPNIQAMTKDATEVKLRFGSYELSSSKQTNEIFIKPILNEIDEAIATLTPEQRSEFRRMYNQIEVEGRDTILPADFVRNSDYHYLLRALRNINFIQPFGGGPWQIGKRIRIKNMGRLAAKLRSTEIGF
jgi:hypothetical protein